MNVFVGDPADIHKYNNKFQEIISLHINFGSPKFKDFSDHFGYIKKWIDNGATSIQILRVNQSDLLTNLPEEVKKCPIQKLEIRFSPQFDDLGSTLKYFPQLQQLRIDCEKIKIGSGFPLLNHLDYLEIKCKEIDHLNGISNCKSLVRLNLQFLNLKNLPQEISELENLENLFLYNFKELKSFPSLENCKKLNTLTIKYVPAIEESQIDFAALDALEHLTMETFGNENSNLDFPKNLETRTTLKNLTLGSVPFPLSEKIGDLNQIESFHLNNFQNLKLLPTSFGNLKGLEKLTLNNLPKLKSIDFDFSAFSNLKQLEINAAGLTHLPKNLGKCSALIQLNLKELTQLEILPEEIFKAETLERILIENLAISSIPSTLTTLPQLNQLTITDCKKLDSIPTQMCKSPSLSFLKFEKNNPEVFRSNTISVYRDVFWDKDVEARADVVDWALKKEREFPIPIQVGASIFKLMSKVGIEKVSVPLGFKIYDLNIDGKKMESTDILDGGKIFISGRLIGGKDNAKTKLEGLGLKVVSKLTDDVQLVLIGNKPKYVDGLYNSKRIYFTQKELEVLKKEVNPGMLQTNDAPPHFIENLNELLLSSDPANIKIALELVHHHGLPYELEESFLVLSHTLPSGKLKNDIRRFLRGKISKLKEVILESKTYPFAPHKVSKLKDDEAARLYHMEYKKTGNINPFFFQHCDASFPDRREMFEKILPTITKNPKRINLGAIFNTEELNELLSLPKFKGTLSDIYVVNPKNSVDIEGLLLHKNYLKKLTVNFYRSKGGFPKSIFELENLTELTLILTEYPLIPIGLGNLKKLKKLTFSTIGTKLILPEDIIQLTNLKQLNVSSRDSNIDDFKGKMPWVNV